MSPNAQSPWWPFTLTLPCEPQRLHDLRRTLTEWLRTTEVPDQTRADVVLATHEAAANAVEHSGTTTGFTTRARVHDRSILVEVRDQGRWKPPALHTGRGRGIPLICGLAHTHTIDRSRTGTTIRMTHLIHQPDTTAAHPVGLTIGEPS